jgi:hypothetical protein
MYIDFSKYQSPIKELLFNHDDSDYISYREIIIVLSNETKIKFIAVGDCCSSSFIEKYENYDFQNLIGKIITDVKEIELPDDYEYKEESNNGYCITPHLYEIQFKKTKETFKFILVNFSNGYYDGWLETEII